MTLDLHTAPVHPSHAARSSVTPSPVTRPDRRLHAPGSGRPAKRDQRLGHRHDDAHRIQGRWVGEQGGHRQGDHGHWERDGVRVCHVDSATARTLLAERPRGTGVVDTRHFRAFRTGRTLTVLHRFDAETISDDAAGLIAAELDATGMLAGPAEFEATLIGLVHSAPGHVPGHPAHHVAASPWIPFYRNSVAALERGSAAFAPVHRRAEQLISGTEVLDLGSCFGFFPLRLARDRRTAPLSVTATDLSAGTMRLLDDAASAMQRPLRTLTCDAASVPLPDRAADTVTVLHLLEHLPPRKAFAVVQEAVRLARRRVIVAVPYEGQAQTCFGHVQTFDARDLHTLGTRLGMGYTVGDHHGGWLVLDH
ncbi:mycofactocin oligosaccharide methyltransferase MftM [Tomitella fengzijianii]|uniref:Class I SAM-dependent methyltransferase n=1 Tax=Tomitella fengzijianii TaxID=2597660 RepID=A0A516X1G5_9ACTN|nr:mycofactocin oligosaccharide methyltransferase MftM [Tomitella fengzijianii]QDQ96926.1 class I SAM-dependent methyltransferase [Tomitella fengzijianii]